MHYREGKSQTHSDELPRCRARQFVALRSTAGDFLPDSHIVNYVVHWVLSDSARAVVPLQHAVRAQIQDMFSVVTAWHLIDGPMISHIYNYRSTRVRSIGVWSLLTIAG